MAKKELIIDLEELTPDPKNARQHSASNLAVIEESLSRFGAARSIVVDKDGVVRAGNGTLAAARKVGFTKVRVVESDGKELVAVCRTDLSSPEAAAYALADNRAGETSEWNPEQLAAILKELEEHDIDMKGLGFDDGSLKELVSFYAWSGIPEDNEDIDEEEMKQTEHECPSCGFKW